MGLVAPRTAFASLFVAALLTFGAASAHAVTYDFTVSPPVPNQEELTTFELTPASADVDRVRWDLDGDGEFDDGDTRTVTHSYADPGGVTVRMRARETKDDRDQTVTKTIRVNARPVADFGFTPLSPRAGEAVAFTPSVTDPEADAVTLDWNFGDGERSAQGAPTHSFADGGTYTVVLTVTDEHGAFTTVSRQVTVGEDAGPSPSFVYSPSAPVAGETVTFTSTSTASQGSIDSVEWDLDADGAYEAMGGEVARSFAAGVHTVTMRVTQTNGRQAVAVSDVEVAEPAPPPDSGSADPGTGDAGPATPGPDGPGGAVTVTAPKPKPPVAMRPFPVVRIAGVVLPHGALVTILSVRAPRGASVLARCRGRGCPARAVARSSAVSLIRFRRFERRLPAGVSLELFVRKGARIGKYTRFRIRAGKAPARVDRCLMPGRKRPVRCP